MKTLYGKKWFKPREVARLGLIKNTTGGDSESSNYDFILMLITTGHINAKNVGRASQARYLIPEDEIIRYHETVNNLNPRSIT